eukprot:CAMPEP_0119354166 /NCGR_PEP_ID=MMETSP1334-20130426/3204_1 /TAXON_ID=127549 /ORGANISM="Calcidiscus leptoporus, Strain RCC1130" /LENGTH=1441 /DNA_ID=CAMNT_0007367649 /DNA_START=67 /DNA_END=4392 /DNA_ORIENTATION=-
MGGGNLQKSQMARAKKQATMAKEGAGGGGSEGMKKRQADAGVHAAANAERAKLKEEREARNAAKVAKEAALERKTAKLNKEAGVPGTELTDKEKKAKKLAQAQAALAAAEAGLPPPKKEAKKKVGKADKDADDEADAMDVDEEDKAAAPEALEAEGEVNGCHAEDAEADGGAADVAMAEFQAPKLSEEELAALHAKMAAREAMLAEKFAQEQAERKQAEAEANAATVITAIKAKKIVGLSLDEFEMLRAAASSTPSDALLTNLLSADAAGCVLYKAISQTNVCVADLAMTAASAAVAASLTSDKAEPVFSKLEAILDIVPAKADVAERVCIRVLQAAGELVGHLGKGAIDRFLERTQTLFAGESSAVGAAAALAAAAALRVAISKGSVAADAEPKELLSKSLDGVVSANAPAESRAAACGVGCAVGALGVGALLTEGVVGKLEEAMASKSKSAAHAREAATLAVGALCISLREKFEAFSIPMLPKLVKLLADKDRKVADAATLSARAMLENLNTLSVKSVVGALYEGMQVVGGGGRVKIECLQLASLLASRAPHTMGPCLPECIPLVIECLNESNGKVQASAEEVLPVLCSCVENAEVAKTLKEVIMLALRKPDTTLACIDEVLMTTFCNPMDGTSLAFMMPILLRGIKDANYELVKKATVCTGNLCALIKESSDVAPFVPLLLPLLDKNLEHSSPDVRNATAVSKTKLLEGAGDEVDPLKRAKALAQAVREGINAAAPSVPAEIATYLGETTSALLESKLGGVVRVKYFEEAVPQATEWISSNLAGVVDLGEGAVAGVAREAVERFKEELSESAKKILADSGDKDFALDMQNIILAFAGRVLLRKADIRFQRGHRYGLIGQNGTGKTTLLNRLATKDINGFPQELRTWYIRHEVLCDDGIDVRSFLTDLAPADKKDEATIEGVLERVQFPEEFKTTYVNSLSGGWKMRMSVAISILHDPELLLLDEPTNHLDREAIDWLTRHLLSLEGVTIAVVSHDYDFIDEVCTDITHYDNGGELGKPCRFVYYPTSFKGFQRLKPEIAAGLPHADKMPSAAPSVVASEAGSEAGGSASGTDSMSRVDSLAKSMDSMSVATTESSSDISTTLNKVEEMIAAGLILPMRFPDPGKPDGVRTYRKPIMTLKDVNFKYVETERYVLQGVTVQLTLGSRAVIIGGNGSGKSTVLKLLIGDLEPEEGVGATWKHHNLRLSYVAQQSLHHLEEYVTVTPIHYIQERFRQGLDAEVGKLKSLALTKEEEAQMKESGACCAIIGRQQRGRHLWYEIQKTGRMKDDTQFFPQTEIEMMFKPYVKKLIKNFDQKQQAIESGMAIRPITAAEILSHLADFGIDSQLAHGKIRQMSGGQRQRLVICAAFWSKPHVIALDEPTNYLDNDSVAALTKALKDFKGAVVTVSENEAFVNEIANEKWVVEGGKITVQQIRDAKAR